MSIMMIALTTLLAGCYFPGWWDHQGDRGRGGGTDRGSDHHGDRGGDRGDRR